MQTAGGLGWAWFLNLGIPLMVLGIAYGCGGVATLSRDPVSTVCTALEGRPHAVVLAQRWDASAALVGVRGVRVRWDGRLAAKPDSAWVYRFRRPGDGMVFEVRRDGRGKVDARPKSRPGDEELEDAAIAPWRVDSPAVAAHASRALLAAGSGLSMYLSQDGIWRVSVEEGEIWVDARSGLRLR